MRRLGELLVSEGKLSWEQLEEALRRQREIETRSEGTPEIGEVLLSFGFVSQEDIARALARQLGLPYLNLRWIILDPAVVEEIGEELMLKYSVAPLRVENERLLVAMSDPNRYFARADLALESGYPLDIVVATHDDVLRAQEELLNGGRAATKEPGDGAAKPPSAEGGADEAFVLPIHQGGRVREIPVRPEAVRLVGEEVLREHVAIPLTLEGEFLLVAVSDLGDPSTIDALAAASDRPVSFIEAMARDIRRAQDALLPTAGGGTDLEVMVADSEKQTEGVSAAEVHEALRSDDPPTLVDVRESEEWNASHIRKARPIPRGLLEFRVADSLPNKEARIVVYCANGGRGALATKTLKDMGYKNVANMKGGIEAWKAERYETI